MWELGSKVYSLLLATPKQFMDMMYDLCFIKYNLYGFFYVIFFPSNKLQKIPKKRK